MLDTTKMTIKGHVLTIVGTRSRVLAFAVERELNHFSVLEVNGEWQLSTALEVGDRNDFKWLYHRMEQQNPSGKPPTKPKGGPKGPTPPTGGSPAAGQVAEMEFVEAIAA